MSIFGEDPIEDIINCGDELNENIQNDAGILSDNEDNPDGEINNELKSEDGKKVEPKRRLVRNARPKLNIDILTGKRGIQTIEKYFEDIKFDGKNHEKEDLDKIMKRLQHWAHRMYPAFKFDDILTTIERLSKKKTLQHYMNRYRQGALNEEINNEINEINDIDKEGNDENEQDNNEPFDEFDALINKQIEISKLPNSTPSTINKTGKNERILLNRNNDSISSSILDTPKFQKGTINTVQTSTPSHEKDVDMEGIVPLQQDIGNSTINVQRSQNNLVSLTKDIPEYLKHRTDLTPEQLEKILENRRLAQERLKAKRAAMNFV